MDLKSLIGRVVVDKDERTIIGKFVGMHTEAHPSHKTWLIIDGKHGAFFANTYGWASCLLFCSDQAHAEAALAELENEVAEAAEADEDDAEAA